MLGVGVFEEVRVAEDDEEAEPVAVRDTRGD